MENANRKRSISRAILDLFYDLFASVISVVDVVSDVMIAIEFYHTGKMVFFWIAITIFIIATISYTVLFIIIFADNLNDKRTTLLFVCLLPFGQVVPLIMWIQGYHFKCIDSLFEYFDLETHPSHQRHMRRDPLRQYIEEKVRKHGGFYVEAMVESVPQSILQMVAIVIYEQPTPLNVFSITVSIVSVASKGIVVSYSIDRPTFAVNFLCFVADVFNIFCTVSWLFFVPSGMTTYNVFFLGSYDLTIFSLIWWWKEFILICVIFGTGVGGIFAALGVAIYEWWQTFTWDRCCKCEYLLRKFRECTCKTFGEFVLVIFFLICAFGFAICLIPPVLIVLEAFKLSMFPLLVNQSMEFKHSDNSAFYDRLFSFLRSGDFTNKVRDVNRYLAQKCITFDGTHGYHFLKAKKVIAMPEEQYTLARIREEEGLTVGDVAHSYAAIFTGNFQNLRARITFYFLFFYLHIVIFFYAISILYSLAYPILCFAMTPNIYGFFLQSLLSTIYISVLLLILLLSPSVYRFKKCTTHLMEFSSAHRFDDDWMDDIINVYSGRLITKIRNEIVVETLDPNIGDIVISYLPDIHIIPRHGGPDRVRDVCKTCTSKFIGDEYYCLCENYQIMRLRERLVREKLNNGLVTDAEMKDIV